MGEKTLKDYLKSRYTTSKEYYSYEKDYLYKLKLMAKEQLKYNPNTTLRSMIGLIEHNIKGTQEMKGVGGLLMLCSLYNNYPVYYIDNEFIELANNTIKKENVVLNHCFVKNAVFLYPKKNKARLKFSVISDDLLDKLFDIKDTVLTTHVTVDSGLTLTNQMIQKQNILTENTLPIERLLCDDIETTVSVVPQIFLYMTTYQEKGMLIENVSNSNGQGFKKSSGKLLTPPTIGFNERHYVNEQKRLCGSNPDLQGIKKQTHWRRGHWRQYDNGKLSWVRPCLINPISE